MNLHDLHSNPKDLDHCDDQDLVPHLAWDYFKNKPREAKRREKIWARDPEAAYEYAEAVLKGPFKLGELAIAKDAEYSRCYAYEILNGPFKLGELAIAKDADYLQQYSNYLGKL